MIITTTAVGLYDNTSPPVPESTGEAGGFGHLPVTLSLQVVIQASVMLAAGQDHNGKPYSGLCVLIAQSCKTPGRILHLTPRPGTDEHAGQLRADVGE